MDRYAAKQPDRGDGPVLKLAEVSPAPPSQTSRRALDWFSFLLADVHAGFGPFLSVYLLSKAWTQEDIGFVLAGAGLVGLVGQMPGGALVDLLRSERGAAGGAMAVIGASAAVLAFWPSFAVVTASTLIYAGANCVLLPALAAISLGLVGHAALGDRLARNARFAAIGGGLATGGMGAIGYLLSNRSVFIVTAALTLPALVALTQIRAKEIDPNRAHGGALGAARRSGVPRVLLRRPFLVLIGGILLFHFANTPGLVLFSEMATARFGNGATVAIAAAIIVSQVVVAVVSPWVGRRAKGWGRRNLLLLSYAILAFRVAAIGLIGTPYTYIGLQLLDGVCAAIFATIVPLVAADITEGTGHFNLAIGVAGTALSIGASAGIAASGAIAGRLGNGTAFLLLSAAAALGFALTWRLMPETRPAER